MRHHSSSRILCTLFVLLALVPASCRPRRETPALTPTRGLPAPLITPFATTPAVVLPGAETPGAAPSASAPAATMAATLDVGTALALVTPSPTPCPLPDGWVIYTIQPGDTLESLADQTGTTVEELMRANCMSDNLIIAYEDINLPSRPPRQISQAQPPAPQVNPPAPVDCNSSLTCVLPGPVLPIISGGPGNPRTYVPCVSSRTDPWVDIHFQTIPALKQGNRVFLYACNFTAGGGMSAVAEYVSTYEKFPLRVYAEHPVPYLSKGTAIGVIDFPARPDWPIGGYTVTVSIGNQSASLPSPIQIVPTTSDQSFILPDPLTASPGDTINIYYVNYPRDENLSVTLYSASPPEYKEAYDALIPRMTWQVTISNPLAVDGPPPAKPAGWGTAPFSFPADALKNAYAVIDASNLGFSMIWIK
jgi:LysM repeat protein